MDLKSMIHPQNAPDSRKGSSPSTSSDDPSGSYGNHSRSHGNGYAPGPPPSTNGAQYTRQPLPLQTTQPIIAPTGNGLPPTQPDQQHGDWTAWGKKQDLNGRSRSQIFCDKLSQNSTAKVDSNSAPYTNGRATAVGSQGQQPSHQTSSQAYTPTGSSPGSAHSSFPRPGSSHSTSTPTSGHYQPAGYTQPSPGFPDGAIRTPSYSQYSQYSAQPHTPLGPPPVRPNPGVTRDSPTSYAYERTSSFGSEGHVPPFTASSHPSRSQSYGLGQSQPSGHSNVDARLRDQSMSVSPKTRVESLPGAPQPNIGSPQHYFSLEKQNSLKRKASDMSHAPSTASEEQGRPKIRRASSMHIDGMLNDVPLGHRSSRTQEAVFSPSRSTSTAVESPGNTDRTPVILEEDEAQPQLVSPTKSHSKNRRNGSTSSLQSSNAPGPMQRETEPRINNTSQNTPLPHQGHVPLPGAQPITATHIPQTRPRAEDPSSRTQQIRKEDNASKPAPASASQPQQPLPMATEPSVAPPIKNRQPPRLETPIFAQSFRKWKHANGDRQISSQPIPHDAHANAHAPTAKQSADNVSSAMQPAHPARSTTPKYGPLGAWEPSILNIIPAEDTVKVVSDFLFREVVLREAIGVGPAGGKASDGAMFEIEAKIGRLINRNTNDRLRLPVMTECVVSQSDPDIRIAFESQMSEAQHRTLNKFLNDALLGSKSNRTGTKPSAVPRVPMDYRHSHETDSFYELTSKGVQALPPAITSHFQSHHKTKTHVRITHDQKTGQELARIIKARVADIDIYSPRSLFDYRISVNIEMNFTGSMEDLVKPDRQRERGGKSDRNKDRMSYKHLAYQIDLTQVTPTEGQQKGTEKDHELEIEVSSAEVRRQGQLARDQQANQYEELVRGFLDNVRVLARHCQT